jgi:hypothetical protein
MNYSSILNEVAAYGAFAVLAGAILILLTLFILLKRDVQKRLQAMSRTVKKAEEECRKAVASIERSAEKSVVPTPPPAPVEDVREQLVPVETRRPQPSEMRNRVLDLSSAGMDARMIAATLSMRENEVRLMLKVHNAMRSCFSPN